MALISAKRKTRLSVLDLELFNFEILAYDSSPFHDGLIEQFFCFTESIKNKMDYF